MKKIILSFFILFELLAANDKEIKTLKRIKEEYRETAYSLMADYPDAKTVEKYANGALSEIKNENIETITLEANQEFPRLELYVYRPKNMENKKLPVIYYFHGGGFLFRRALGYSNVYQELADNTKTIVVTPRYRLSTEAPFPAALLDSYRGLKFIKSDGEKYNFDKDRIILMGQSAGGGLAASVALYNRDSDNIPILGQILVYPMLDSRTGGENSLYKSPFVGEVAWTSSSNRYAWEVLQGGNEIKEEMLSYFSPAQTENLTNLPPALIYVGDLDLFVNEDIDYANRLIQAGVPTELHLINGLYHAFDVNSNADETKKFKKEVYETIEDMLK